MIRFLATWFARKQYVWREEVDAALKDLNANAAQFRAGERRKEVKRLTAEADAIDASIKDVDEKMEKGYWLCENGHENQGPEHNEMGSNGPVCFECSKPAKFIRSDLMTGQEKYESDKERKEAVQMASANRKAAQEHEEQIKGHEDTATMFHKQAVQAREFADLLRKL